MNSVGSVVSMLITHNNGFANFNYHNELVLPDGDFQLCEWR